MKKSSHSTKHRIIGRVLPVCLLFLLVLSVSAGALAAQTASAQRITEAEAKAIALGHAEVTEQDLVFITTRLGRDDRREVYDVEFFTATAEYDYEIDAVSGEIREYDREIDYGLVRNPEDGSYITSGNVSDQPGSVESGAFIGEDEARSIALADSGLSESQIRRMEIRMDRERGQMVYEVEFKSGRTDYEYELDAFSGEILHADAEYDD